MTHFLLYIIKVWVTVACSHAEMPLLCLMHLASMVKTILGLWCSVVSLLIAALNIHAQRNQLSQTVHTVSPFLVWEWHFLMEALEKQDTVRCQGMDHQPRHRWQIYRISVSLSGFKAQTYGCHKNLLLLFSTAAKTKAKVKAYDTMISYWLML